MEERTEEERDILKEIGNIMGNSYITAIGAMLDLRMEISVPRMVVDEGNCVLQTFLEGHEEKFEKLLFVDSAFKAEDTTLESCMLLCPTDDSLSAMLDKLSF